MAKRYLNARCICTEKGKEARSGPEQPLEAVGVALDYSQPRRRGDVQDRLLLEEARDGVGLAQFRGIGQQEFESYFRVLGSGSFEYQGPDARRVSRQETVGDLALQVAFVMKQWLPRI